MRSFISALCVVFCSSVIIFELSPTSEIISDISNKLLRICFSCSVIVSIEFISLESSSVVIFTSIDLDFSSIDNEEGVDLFNIPFALLGVVIGIPLLERRSCLPVSSGIGVLPIFFFAVISLNASLYDAIFSTMLDCILISGSNPSDTKKVTNDVSRQTGEISPVCKSTEFKREITEVGILSIILFKNISVFLVSLFSMF